MSLDADQVYRCINAFLYTAEKQKFAQSLTTHIDIERFKTSSPEDKLLLLGALLTCAKKDEFGKLVQDADFSALDSEVAKFVVMNLMGLFGDVLDEDVNTQRGESGIAPYLLLLLTAVFPQGMRAHEQSYVRPDNKLVEFEYASKISPLVSGVVFFREFMFGPGSRKHEFGHRIQTALASQEWDIRLVAIEGVRGYSSQEIKDLALLDVGGFGGLNFEQIREVVLNLRKYFRKIIMIEPDPWTGKADELLYFLSDVIDYVWGFTADWPLAKTEMFRERSIFFPNVGGFDHISHDRLPVIDSCSCRFNFTGSVQGYNLNRIYWILEMIRRKMPVIISVTNPSSDDGLNREESLKVYADKLALTNASINFTTRPDGSRILTGRAVEVISLNRLLIQEACPAFHSYYKEGEHFLEFADIDQLANIIDFLKVHPRTALKISEQGYQYYLARYSSKKMVEHLQTWL